MSTRAPLAIATLLALFLGGQGALAGPPAGQTRGEVVWVDGEIIVVSIRSGPSPAVGDTVSVSKPPDAAGNAVAIGRWRVVDVQGTSVRAALEERFGEVPQVGMEVTISASGSAGSRDAVDVVVPGAARSGVRGKVTEVRGQEVTIRLEASVRPAVGDRVELSFAAGEDTITVGAWRVTAVRPDASVDAAPVEALATPTTAMDATVFASGSQADVLFGEASAIRAQDPARALELLEQAAHLGHAEAAEQAAFAYMRGQGVARDDTRAAPLFRQAAQAGRPDAQNAFGVFLTLGRGGVQKDPAAGADWYRKAAAQGDPEASSNLCGNYLEGVGVEKDPAEALRLCTVAAAQQNANALDRLGWMHQNGLGVPIDLAKAFEHYSRAAALGHANGQNNLGILYESGWGVGRDPQQALHWFRLSAAQGSPWAEWNLGRMYQDGIGVPRDQAAAVEHFRRAARGGHSQSQERLRQLGVAW